MAKNATKNGSTAQPKVKSYGFLASFGSLLPALALLACGLLLTIWPALSTRVLCMGAGALLVVYGIVQIVLYFSRDVEIGILRNSLMQGLLFLGLGIFLMIRPMTLASVLPLVMGTVLIIGGAYKMQVAFDVWRMHDSKWFIFVVLGLAILVLGIVILMNPFASAVLLMRVIGIGLICEGVMDVLAIIRIHQIRKNFEADTIPLRQVVDVPEDEVTPVADTAQTQPAPQVPVDEEAAGAEDTTAPAETTVPTTNAASAQNDETETPPLDPSLQD